MFASHSFMEIFMAKRNPIELLKYMEKHQSGHRYKRKIPKNLQAEFNGKKLWIVTFPGSIPDDEVMIDVARLSAKHSAMIRDARNRPLTNDEIADAEWRASQFDSMNKDQLRGVINNLIAGSGGERNLAIEDRGFVGALRNEGKVPLGVALSIAKDQDRETYGQDRKDKPIEYAVSKFIDEIGDKDITQITRAEVVGWLAMNSDRRRGRPLKSATKRLGHVQATGPVEADGPDGCPT